MESRVLASSRLQECNTSFCSLSHSNSLTIHFSIITKTKQRHRCETRNSLVLYHALLLCRALLLRHVALVETLEIWFVKFYLFITIIYTIFLILTLKNLCNGDDLLQFKQLLWYLSPTTGRTPWHSGQLNPSQVCSLNIIFLLGL